MATEESLSIPWKLEIVISFVNEIITNRLNLGIIRLKRLESSVNEPVTPGICKDYVVTHRQTDTHTQTDYYNPPPTRSSYSNK